MLAFSPLAISSSVVYTSEASGCNKYSYKRQSRGGFRYHNEMALTHHARADWTAEPCSLSRMKDAMWNNVGGKRYLSLVHSRQPEEGEMLAVSFITLVPTNCASAC